MKGALIKMWSVFISYELFLQVGGREIFTNNQITLVQKQIKAVTLTAWMMTNFMKSRLASLNETHSSPSKYNCTECQFKGRWSRLFRTGQARKARRCDSYLQPETINHWPTHSLTDWQGWVLGNGKETDSIMTLSYFGRRWLMMRSVPPILLKLSREKINGFFFSSKLAEEQGWIVQLPLN